MHIVLYLSHLCVYGPIVTTACLFSPILNYSLVYADLSVAKRSRSTCNVGWTRCANNHAQLTIGSKYSVLWCRRVMSCGVVAINMFLVQCFVYREGKPPSGSEVLHLGGELGIWHPASATNYACRFMAMWQNFSLVLLAFDTWNRLWASQPKSTLVVPHTHLVQVPPCASWAHFILYSQPPDHKLM